MTSKTRIAFFYNLRDMVRMDRRMVIFALALIMISGALVPLCSEDTDAVGPDDFKVSIPGYNWSIPIEAHIGNGHSQNYTIYLTNLSDHVLDISFMVENVPDVIRYTPIDSITLMPAGDKSGQDMVKVNFVISVIEVTTSQRDLKFWLQIRVCDITDDSITLKPLSFVINVESSFDMSGSYNKFFGFIDNTLPEPFNTPYVPFFVTLIGFVIIALIVVRLLIPTLSKFMDGYTKGNDRKRFQKLLTLAVLLISLALFLDPGLRILGADLSLIFYVEKFSLTLLIVILAITIWKVYIMVAESVLKKMGEMEDSKIDSTLLPIFSMIGKLFLWVGGIAAILHVHGFDLSGILLSAGIISLGITLGAQSVLSQFFSGISLLLTRPFAKGDYLEIAGETYIVKRVKLMYTEFTGTDKDRVITIPNNVVSGATIVNMTKYDKSFRLQVFFQIPYDVEVAKAEEVVLKMAEESPHVMHNYNKYKKPAVRLIEFQDSGVLLRLDVTIADYANMPVIQSDLKKELYIRLAEANIEMPYNRLEVTILKDQDVAHDTNPA